MTVVQLEGRRHTIADAARDERAESLFAHVILRSAARIEPNLAQAHYRLAQAYRRTGQEALAAKELEIFERLNPRND